jgi:hypothetical protein
MVQHVPQQGGKAETVQPVITEPSISTKGGVGVVVHLSKQRRNRSHFIHRIETTTKLNINVNNKHLTQILKAGQNLFRMSSRR